MKLTVGFVVCVVFPTLRLMVYGEVVSLSFRYGAWFKEVIYSVKCNLYIDLMVWFFGSLGWVSGRKRAEVVLRGGNERWGRMN